MNLTDTINKMSLRSKIEQLSQFIGHQIEGNLSCNQDRRTNTAKYR